MAEHQDPPEPQDEPEQPREPTPQDEPEQPREPTPQQRAVMERSRERTVGRKRRLGKPIPSPPQSEQESVLEPPGDAREPTSQKREVTRQSWLRTLSRKLRLGKRPPQVPPMLREPAQKPPGILDPEVSFFDLQGKGQEQAQEQPAALPGAEEAELAPPKAPGAAPPDVGTEPRRWLPESDIPRPDQDEPGFPGLKHPRPEFPDLDQQIPSDNAEASNQAGDGAGLVQGLDELTRLVEGQSRTLEEALSLLREIKAELPKVGGLT